MNEIVKKLLRAKLVPSVISIVFGIVLILARRSAIGAMVKIAAGLLIACGVGCVLMYLFAPVRESMQLAVGALLAGIGLLAWFNTDLLLDLFPVLAGIALILNGLSNLATVGVPGEFAGTGITTVFSILMIVAGLFIVFHPAAVESMIVVWIGCTYIVNGVFDLILLHRAKNVLLS